VSVISELQGLVEAADDCLGEAGVATPVIMTTCAAQCNDEEVPLIALRFRPATFPTAHSASYRNRNPLITACVKAASLELS
jgi:hypothetical protein